MQLWEKFESTKAEVEDMNGTVVGSESEAGMTLQQLLTQVGCLVMSACPPPCIMSV